MIKNYLITGLAENKEHATMIQDGVSKITGVDEAQLNPNTAQLTVVISRENGILYQLIQYVVKKVDSGLDLEKLDP